MRQVRQTFTNLNVVRLSSAAVVEDWAVKTAEDSRRYIAKRQSGRLVASVEQTRVAPYNAVAETQHARRVKFRHLQPPLVSMSELHHECGVAAIYHLPHEPASPLCTEQGPEEISRLVPRMLLDIQNRGQLSAGMTSFNPDRKTLLETHRDLGSVSEVFRMSHRGKYESLMSQFTGRAAIGHVRY